MLESVVRLFRPVCPQIDILVLRESSLHALACHDWLVRNRSRHAVRVHLRVVRLHGLLHESAVEALLLRDGTVFVRQEERLEIDHLFPELGNLGGKSIVLATKHFHFVLEVGEPLLLTLTTLEGSHTTTVLVPRGSQA